MMAVAVGWQVYELSGDPLDLGLIGLAEFLPLLLLALPIIASMISAFRLDEASRRCSSWKIITLNISDMTTTEREARYRLIPQAFMTVSSEFRDSRPNVTSTLRSAAIGIT